MSDTDKGGLSKMLKDKSSKRFLIFGGIVVAGAVGWTVLGGGTPKIDPSSYKAPTGSGGTVGTVAPTDAYGWTQRADDAARAAAAKERANANPFGGASSTPSILVQGETKKLPEKLDVTGQEQPKPEAPPSLPVLPSPETPRNPMEARVNLQQSAQQTQQPQKPVVDQQLMQAMVNQMNVIRKGTEPSIAKTDWYYSVTQAQAAQAQGAARGYQGAAGFTDDAAQGSQQRQAASAATATGRLAARFRPPVAGTILYARLVGKVNSDVPGPVVAEILQGAFRGARLLGTFQTTEQGVVISFSTMTVPYTEEGEQKSEVVAIKAVAVDSANLGTAMATDIDRHLFEKVVFSAATAFLQGFGQAIGNSGTTTVIDTNGASVTSNPLRSTNQQLWQAGGTAAGKTGDVLNQTFGNRKTTVTVDADTNFGLLFLPANAN